MTAATVDWGGKGIRIISTHFQPDDGAVDATGRQAAIFAGEFERAALSGPVIAGGDLNTTVGSRPWRAIMGTGVDALAPVRPALTWSSDHPDTELDHLFTRGLHTERPRVIRSQLSDHFMIAVTIRP